MDFVKQLTKQVAAGERTFIRDGLVRNLLVVYGPAGTAKRMRAICFLTHDRTTLALKAYLKAAKNILALCSEICPLTGKRYIRAKHHVKNKKIVMAPYQIIRQLYKLGGFYIRKAHHLNRELTLRAISQVHGFSTYRRYLIFRGLYWQH